MYTPTGLGGSAPRRQPLSGIQLQHYGNAPVGGGLGRVVLVQTVKTRRQYGTHLSVVGLLVVAAVGKRRSLYGTGLNVVIFFVVLFSLSRNNQLCTGPYSMSFFTNF